ncbi:MAG TPA: two-component regulator propeller domain-containing protein [Opitutaceae bacterium]|nr:two-component regulator propeller domain-containing protein [Opitutaceae bacterium]
MRLPCAYLAVAALASAGLLSSAMAAADAGDPGSPWIARVWRSDDGLPNNHVTGLAQTADGYLWVATYSAPARFDGVGFEEFLPKDLGVGANQKISALSPARGGGLWLGTLHGGIVRLDAQGAALTGDGLPYKPVEEIVEDSNGALWITHQGGSVARFQEGRLTTFGRDQGLPHADTPNRYVCSLALDGRGQLWFSKDGQIGVFRDGRFVTLLRLNPINARIARASGGGVWISSEGQLFSFAEDRPLASLGRFTEAVTNPTALLEDSQGAVWIGTADAGLFRHEGIGFQAVPISDRRIAGIAEDRKGNLWVGTVGGGLNQVRPRLITLENEQAGLPTGVVQSLAEDKSGALWATTPSGLLLHRAGRTWQTISAGPKWPGGRASALAVDQQGTLWIGTRDRALHRWKDGVFSSVLRPDGLAGREIHALVAARNGDLWIGLSSPDVVQRWRDGRLETFAMPDNVRVIRAMAEDTAGNIWIGSSRGLLLRIRDSVVTDETRRTTGEPRSIRCLRATPDGGLWIGYADDGIGWWKEGRFTHATSAQGFPEPNVSQIIADDAGWLWFAGDHGIFKVRQSALEELAAGQSPRAHFIRYGQSEGLFTLEANFGDAPGALRTRDGRLLIPLRTALAVIDPRQAREDPEPPALLLKRVLVDDKVVAAYGGTVPVRNALDLGTPGATLSLPPGHFRLSFEFATLSYRAPENARFRYRLEGFDRDWVDAGTQRSAAYSRLAARDYRFHVQACNSDGVWNEHGAALAFVVTPFVWQTWWFRLAAVLAFTAGTALVVWRLSLRRVRERLRRLEEQAAVHKERSRIARDLHDEFGTRLTELGLLAELDRKATDVPARGSSDLIGNIRALERDLDTIVWAVNPKNDTLDHLVGFVCRVSSEFLQRSGIRCRFDIPDDLPAQPLSPELRHNLFLVVREALNNVVKHASATLVKISIALERDALRLRIENNGRGFAVDAAEAGERNGLKNMRSRTEELGGTFSIESQSATGTTIELLVPLEPSGRERERVDMPLPNSLRAQTSTRSRSQLLP